MRISMAQLNFHIGNFEGNLSKMLKAVEVAKEQAADIVIFSELCVCGYPPRDFLEFEDFINRSQKVIKTLTQAADGIAIVVGSPSRNPVIEGKDLFNSAYFLAEKEVKHVTHKTLLPTYDIFDEYRYFEPNTTFEVVEFGGKKIALTICEDIWNVGNENPLYTVCPLDELMVHKPDFIINISASPFSYNQPATRLHVLQANTSRYHLPMFYCNHVGAQTEIIFEGGSLVMSPDGSVFRELPFFEEAMETFDLEEVIAGNDSDNLQERDKMDLIHDAIVLGVRDYFGKLGFKSAILGLSGGIDSAVTCALAVRALGKENVKGVLMPSEFSSDHSVADAKALAENLGIDYEVIPILKPYDSFIDTLTPSFKGKPFDVTEENIQARIRGIILMALSNKFGYILLNTSNKSEAAVGYGTLYGDMAGGLSVIGDVYKTEVFELARFINKDGEIIPENSITKPPSAELRPNQKDSDSLPPYDELDKVLYQYIEMRLGPNEIIEMGFDEKLVRKTLRLVNINEFKRYQTAPMIRVSSKAFGMGRRMPIVGKYLS